MESMKALLCTLVLVSSFGYGTCEKCWNDYNCKYGCCNWECCAGYNYYVYLGVGVTFGVVTIIGVVVIIACLLKKNTRPGRVIAATRPAPGLAVHSHFTATNSSGQTQSSSFVYPAPQGSPVTTLTPPTHLQGLHPHPLITAPTLQPTRKNFKLVQTLGDISAELIVITLKDNKLSQYSI